MRSYLEVIEEFAISEDLHKGEIENFTKEILMRSATTLNCTRCNIWLFENNQTKLVSLLAYNAVDNSFSNGMALMKDQYPNYFKFLKMNKIIVSNNASEEAINEELLENYIVPNKITSMIDVPLRSEGKMIGVLCFEHVKKLHIWSVEEENFTQSVAQLFSLALETKKKKDYRLQLENIINQKEVLISEINHRVKNNMAVIISLMNLQKRKTKDKYHAKLFEEIKDKVFSMSMIQEQLHTSGTINNIDLGVYLENLLINLNFSYGLEKQIKFNLDLQNKIVLDVSKAIPCGLISNEILTNSFKYAFVDENLTPELTIQLKQKGQFVELVFKDNGIGFHAKSLKSGMGLELIKDLANQIDATLQMNSDNGVGIKLVFPCN